jgi:hypothetical protein
VYARRIYAGWLVAPDPVLPRRTLTLESTNLREDHDLDPGDGELTFWWLNVNLAEAGWLRLSDYADGNMDDYDDEFASGNGEMGYTNATVDFYLRHGQNVTVASQGYEQDCFDNHFDGFWFTHRRLELAMYVACYASFSDAGAGDPIARPKSVFLPEDLGPRTVKGGDEYDLRLNVAEVPIDLEDMSYLSVRTQCTAPGEVALAGQPISCEALVNNGGTGLPRRVEVTSRVSGPPAATIDAATWSLRPPLGTGTPYPCAVAGNAVCRPELVPVAIGSPLRVSTTVTPTAAGLLTGRAEVTTASNDPDLADNVATSTIEVFQPIVLDVAPRDAGNVVNLGRGGSLTVAILTTAGFDASVVDPLSVCFGDAGTAAERTCSEQHATGHLEDVNRDRLPDLVLHFAVRDTGIDAGDTSACLRARTRDGIGLYGCDAIVTR